MTVPRLLQRGSGRLASLVIVASLGILIALASLTPTYAADLAPLTIETSGGTKQFQVEIAADEATRERGLMYRQSLAADHGMLFVFDSDRQISMWMKNTYIPLDMVFIRSDGRIHRIEERTTPFSERVIEAGDKVRYVLELAGGTAAALGVKRGDLVRAAAIKP